MNIFATDECPIKSAKALPCILLRKMIVESCQILCTAHFICDGVIKSYKPTHQNHPVSIWTRKSTGNYNWLYQHYVALCSEFSTRNGKPHASMALLKELKTAPKNSTNKPVDIDFMCMPVECKKTIDVHKNYRYYLNQKYKDWATRTDKKQIHVTWTNAVKPDWVIV